MPFIILLCFSVQTVLAQSSVLATSLFDGNSLSGWKVLDPAEEKLWSIADNKIIGGDGVSLVKANTYLYTEKEYEDFEFRCLFKLSGDSGTGFINSGIQYRSFLKEGQMVGYQADIGDGHWGDIYDEHRRGLLVSGDLSILKEVLNTSGWNTYIIRVRGNHHELYINGVKTSDYVEKDNSIPPKGIIALQLHDGGSAKVEFKHLTITEL